MYCGSGLQYGCSIKAPWDIKAPLPVSYFACKSASFWSGAEGIRTPDLRRAKAALSRLSYGPERVWRVEFTAVAWRGLTAQEFGEDAGSRARARWAVGESVASGLDRKTM